MKKYNNKYGESTVFEDTNIGKLIVKKYETPPAKYPGVSKILSETTDKSFLEEWRKRVGDEEADRIVKESTDIGTSFDKLLYDHFTNKPVILDNECGAKLYNQVKGKYLDRIKPIALQLHIHSKKLKMQGYIDCLGYYNGELSIIDFKNSKRHKDEDHLTNYYLQCTYYAMMLHEMFGIVVKNIVLLIGMRRSPYPDIRLEKVSNFTKSAIQLNKKYYLTST